MTNSRAIHFDGCVLTFEPRWGDELPEPDRTEIEPGWEESTDSQPRIGLSSRIVLGIAIALLRQTIFSTETKVDRGSLANFSQWTSEGAQTNGRAADREFSRR